MSKVLCERSDIVAIADAVRSKTGSTDAMTLGGIVTGINGIETGIALPELTNEGSASDLLSGKELIDGEGNVVTGAIETKTASDLTANGATVTVPAGYYVSGATKTISSGSAKTPATTITKAPTISVNSSGLITASVSGTQNVTPTVSAGYVSSGTAGTITVSGSATKQLTTQAAKTITPTTSSQTAVASGVYTTGAVTVAAIPSSYVQPSGTKTITANGTYDVKSYASATVNTSGEDVTEETSAYTTKLASLETAISALETELEGKAGGSSGGTSVETCTVRIVFDDTYNILGYCATILEEGVITIDASTENNLGDDSIQELTVSNVVVGSSFIVITDGGAENATIVENLYNELYSEFATIDGILNIQYFTAGSENN